MHLIKYRQTNTCQSTFKTTDVSTDDVMVKALACDSRGREFNSQPSRCQVTTLDKLFTHMFLHTLKRLLYLDH